MQSTSSWVDIFCCLFSSCIIFTHREVTKSSILRWSFFYKIPKSVERLLLLLLVLNCFVLSLVLCYNGKGLTINKHGWHTSRREDSTFLGLSLNINFEERNIFYIYMSTFTVLVGRTKQLSANNAKRKCLIDLALL